MGIEIITKKKILPRTLLLSRWRNNWRKFSTLDSRLTPLNFAWLRGIEGFSMGSHGGLKEKHGNGGVYYWEIGEFCMMCKWRIWGVNHPVPRPSPRYSEVGSLSLGRLARFFSHLLSFTLIYSVFLWSHYPVLRYCLLYISIALLPLYQGVYKASDSILLYIVCNTGRSGEGRYL